MEKVLWLIECVRSGLWSLVLEISCWTDFSMFHSQVDQLKWSNWNINWEQSTFHVRDCQHTQNIQINKVIGENEKYDFYFTEKTKQTFWSIQYDLKKLTL